MALTIDQIRAQYPQYKDMSDSQLADALHAKFYSDMPRDEFNAKVGLKPSTPASSPASEQPSFMQDVAASPVGRLVHDAVVQPAEGLASLALKAIPGVNMLSGGFDQSQKQVAEAPYQGALAAQRNLPGYAQARARADRITAKRNVGFTDQITAPFNNALAGTAGLLMGGSMNDANAASDSQEAAQAQYQKAHPIASITGQLLGGLAAIPEGSPTSSLLLSTKPKGPPSIASLKNDAASAYQQVDNSGMLISQPTVKNMVDKIKSDLANHGFHPKLQPKTAVVLDTLDEAAAQPQTLQGMDVIKRIAKTAIDPMNKSDTMMARRIGDTIDQTVTGLGPNDVIGSVDQNALDALSNARDLWSRSSKAQIIQDQIDKARLASQSMVGNAPGLGFGNALRTRFRQLANNDRAMAKFSVAEREAIKRVATGSPVENVLRLVGKLSPDQVIPALAEMGAATVNPAALAVPVAGAVSKAGASALTKAAAQRALNTALLGRSAIPPAAAPLLGPMRLPQTFPYGLIGATAPQFAQ